MSVKFTKNADGTTTIRIPKTAEVYDPVDAALYVEATVTADELSAAKADAKSAPVADPKPTPAEAVIANWVASDALAHDRPVPPAVAVKTEAEPYNQPIEDPAAKPVTIKV
jgi:hypothetical protein